MAKETYAETPLMKQYNQIKAKHPDAILFFRVGDFYEMFAQDAIVASGILGITLTKRANGKGKYIELAGFPYHAVDTYLPKLVRAGQRVAICEQLEDPKLTKKIVKRGVTELITPGVTLSDNVLDIRENNFLACINIGKYEAGVAFLDISTGEFYLTEGKFEYIDKLLSSFAPKEVLYERSKYERFEELFGSNYYTYKIEDWAYENENAKDRLLRQFDTLSLKGFGVHELELGIAAAGAVLQYLDLTEHRDIKHITRISRIEEDNYVWLDKFTIRNLELFGTGYQGTNTVLNVIDKTISPPGARLMRRLLSLPLKNLEAINNRHDIVEFFISDTEKKTEIRKLIKKTGDLERMNSKIASQRISPRDVMQLKNALYAVEEIKKICQNSENKMLLKIADSLNFCENIRTRIEKEIHEDPPVHVSKGKAIANGISEELDELRKISGHGKEYLANMQRELAYSTGISSLKISFNNVFGYYFEVRNKFKTQVPQEWTRKQTLVSSERYINQELKDYEDKILGAEDKILKIETQIFNDLVLSLADYIPIIQTNAMQTAHLDCMVSFALTAEKNNYVRPKLDNSDILYIKKGRHPVIEQQLSVDNKYIPNDIFLDAETQQIIIVTGPNMAGKSALLRQTALIVLLAQIGSFVPAESAEIGIVDKIFTRVGASDNISSGESTFMVEMNEASSILNNLSQKSLILFDELGRGTSTYDGISIAWAIVEHIHENPNAKAKTLFATHYHELNEMEKSFDRIKNFNVSVQEIKNKIIFLRKLVPGGSQHSFGIHVAKLAGMPKSVVARANTILKELEKSHRKEDMEEKAKNIASHREGMQLSFFQLDDPVLSKIKKEIENIDIDNLTPINALNKLNEIKKLLSLK